MFQTFDAPPETNAGADRVKALRARFQRLGIDAFIVPNTDEFQSEYVPASEQRLRWLTGFSGSAGNAVIGFKRAAFVTDGRYTLQAAGEIDTDVLEIVKTPETSLTDWIISAIGAGSRVGFDPWLHAVGQVEAMSEAFRRDKIKLKPIASNPIDSIWPRRRPDRPAKPSGLIVPQPVAYTGRSAEEKIAELQATLKADNQLATVLTASDSIAWLLNIRGSDVPHNPIVLAYAIVPQSGPAELFVDPAKLGPEAKAHLSRLVRVSPPAAFAARLKFYATPERSGQGRSRTSKPAKVSPVRIDPTATSYAIVRRLGGRRRVIHAADPVKAVKAVKTAVELEGARMAHVRDGVAVCRFLAWLDRTAPDGDIDEIGAAQHLERLRTETNELKELSFDTISGSGPNGAIVHYRVTTKTNRRLRPGELYLIDSGAQYIDGTTDVTRTVAIGRPTADMRRHYTLVLKGHIAIATARFPEGTAGGQLDSLARLALWQNGLDYDHGTGHGIGSYLCVHEGPQSLSKRHAVALKAGMILSNEPGFYKTGAYGIRIENLLIVSPAARVAGGDRPMLSLETITLAPMDRRLIDTALLIPAELAWIDTYHKRVRTTLAAKLAKADRTWLEAATAPL
jgi:Xaa-Pro aminopeptidase